MEQGFDEILREFLIMRNLTQTAFANTIGVKQSQVSEWINGKAKPGYDTLKRIAMSYNISADYYDTDIIYKQTRGGIQFLNPASAH